MEAQLIGLAVQTYKIALLIALPMLMAGLVMGLLVSIFQAATQINEMTLTFVPKILVVIGVLIFIMPWMMNMIMEFTIDVFELIPEFPF
ncbi:MAG: flagellar biosynthesis protein FliQ [Campylobacterales bacterium]